MSQLIVKEKYSKHWPVIAVVSAVIALLFWGAYMFSTDVLVEGYLRFAAFCFFALSLLSFFKVKDGQIRIDLKFDDNDTLLVNYQVRKKQIASETFDLTKIKAIEINEMPNRSLYNDFATGDKTIRFKRTDSDGWLYLIEVNGRVIPFDNKNAQRVFAFINGFLDGK